MQHTNTETGVIMLDLKGLTIEPDERELLMHSQVGGIILFSRNYASPQQLGDLVASIKQCNDHLLVARGREGLLRILARRI